MILKEHMDMALVEVYRDIIGETGVKEYLNCEIVNNKKMVQLLGDNVKYIDSTTVGIVRGNKTKVITFKEYHRLLNRASNRGIIANYSTVYMDYILEEIIAKSALDSYKIAQSYEEIVGLYTSLNIYSCISDGDIHKLEMLDLIGFKMIYVNTDLLRFRALLLEHDGVTYISTPYCSNDLIATSIWAKLRQSLGYVNIADYPSDIIVDAPNIVCYIDIFNMYYNEYDDTIRLTTEDDLRLQEIDISNNIKSGYDALSQIIYSV